MDGGGRIAGVLATHGVSALFTLCGGHISPILVRAKQRGIRVVDVRDEASAVFAADATARLTGRCGVAAVTAGPGATNTLTAVKNAQLAQSPVVVIGGAAPTILKGRGALQDIDQLALFRPHVKRAVAVRRRRDLVPKLDEAFRVARRGVPGPVFVECPVDLLYEERVVRDWYGVGSPADAASGLPGRLRRWYLRRHLDRIFADGASAEPRPGPERPESPWADRTAVSRAVAHLERCARPILLVGSQATLEADEIADLAEAVAGLGIPVYLSGMARGLLGAGHRLHLRHGRRKALREADLVILAGVPCDFRLDYGRHIGRETVLVSVNRSRQELRKNRRPRLGVVGDPAAFLRALAESADGGKGWTGWLEELRRRDRRREEEMARLSTRETDYVNPLALCREIDRALADDSVIVADGGDFVATASYVLSPRRPLSWLDPGVFGTLGVGAGFAMGASIARPDAEIWILYGDGSAAYSLAEFDTFRRHGLAVIAVVGNDAGWTQIAREQVELLGDDAGTVLRRTDYHRVAEGFGGTGFRLESGGDIESVLVEAKAEAGKGVPVLVNAWIGATDFRKGSISI